MEKSATRDILDFFPRGKTPRDGQAVVLKEIEESYEKADVFVIEVPTAGGKEALSKTIAKWASSVHREKGHIIVPTNILVEQGRADGTFSLRKKHEYTCEFPLEGRTFSCEEGAGPNCHGKHCSGCPYVKDLRRARVFPYQVSNYYSYMAHKLYTPVLIVDEAHGLVKMLKDLNAKKLWARDYEFPSWVRSYSSALNWAKTVNGAGKSDAWKKKLSLLVEDLSGGHPRYLVERAIEPLRGHAEPLLKLLPIDTSSCPPVLWPKGKVRKIFLLSATIGKSDIRQMGLDNRRVCWISVPSPIPASRRPFISEPVVTLNTNSSDADYESLAAYVNSKLETHGDEKGLIHMPYSLVERMQRLLDNPRLIWHTRDNKMEKFAEYRNSAEPCVLVCSGLYEGIDLPYDACRWQILSKIPWQNLGEPAIRYIADNDRLRYAWDTLRDVIQAAGRVCRTPDDLGVSFCPDKSFARMPRELMPTYFLDALEAGEDYKLHEQV